MMDGNRSQALDFSFGRVERYLSSCLVLGGDRALEEERSDGECEGCDEAHWFC